MKRQPRGTVDLEAYDRSTAWRGQDIQPTAERVYAPVHAGESIPIGFLQRIKPPAVVGHPQMEPVAIG